MNPRPTIGILSPGDMGHAIAAVLQQHGLRVLTNLQGRSPRTVALAKQAGIIDVADDILLVREADIFLSILVPSQAVATAERIANAVLITGTSLFYVDCNAIAPATVLSIDRLITEAGATVVDAGIIGSPPKDRGVGPHLYVSGPKAQQLEILSGYGLDVRVVGSSIGQASGLKMCYASLTKGLIALGTQALTAGRLLGLTDALTHELQESQPMLLHLFERQLPQMPPKAYRWVGEMEEIAHTFAALGLPFQMLEGAAATYRLVEKIELGAETPEMRRRGQTLQDVISILATALEKASNGD